MPKLNEPTYLGDSVYAEFDGYQIWIYTSNGYSKENMIALEPSVLRALNDYATRCQARAQAAAQDYSDEA